MKFRDERTTIDRVPMRARNARSDWDRDEISVYVMHRPNRAQVYLHTDATKIMLLAHEARQLAVALRDCVEEVEHGDDHPRRFTPVPRPD